MPPSCRLLVLYGKFLPKLQKKELLTKLNKLNMKNIVLTLSLCLAILLSFNTAKSQNDTILNVQSNNNTLLVQFNLPAFTIIDTTLVVPYGITEIFKYIEIDDEFGCIDSVGLPQLPQLTFDLHVPYNATDFEIKIISATTKKIGINRKIMPAQEDVEKENPIFNFSKNNSYYNSSGGFCNFHVQYNESFIVFGEQGINLTIFPFIYNPGQDSLTVLNSAVFAISYTLSKNTKEGYYTDAKENYLNNLFKNYNIDNTKTRGAERYLMITAPDYESTLTYFANYKRNIGYDVKVVTTNTTGSTASSIKNYIQNQYNSTSTRPTYVLLVGDVDKIPAFAGDDSGGDKDNPITDLGYSLLEGNDNLADVFLGRFSVSKPSELINIINKTLFMEMNMHRFTKKAKFLAGKDGTSNWIYMESEFRRGHNYVIPYSFEPLGYNCEKLYQTNQTNAENALNDNPLFYIYSGHGSAYSLAGHSFSIDDDVIASATNSIFPFVFAFACKTGNFAKEECIGETVIRAKNKGGVAYFGCSVNSQTNTDVAMEKKVFGDAFKKDQDKLAAIINLGKRRFTYVAGIRDKRKTTYLKAYNILGDPSFDTKGIGCKQNFVFNNPEIFKDGADVTYRADNLIQNNDSFVVESGAEVKLLAGNSVVLKPGFRAEAGSNVEIRITPCAGGVIRNSEENNNEEFDDITENLIDFKTEEVVNYMVIDEIIHPAIFSVFPNPTTDDFSLAYTLENNSFVQIDLYNMTGTHIKNFLQIAQQEAGVYYHNFSLSGLSSGLYILVFKNEAKTISSKIIKH